jgi:uncharacterized protein (DUF1800 family)
VIALSYTEASYLLRRAGFGGTPPEVESLAELGREGAVDFLLNYETIDNSAMESAISKIDVVASGEVLIVEGRPESLFSMEMRRWWLARMIMTKRPFEEKMTLFWHHHFATSLEKVFQQLMMQQNMTLRQYGLDRFDTLLIKIAKDPAMLVWLDGETNQKTNPNENFARELQELFTMGTHDVVTGEPNYTEKDVKEIARAFTGLKFKIKKKGGYKVTLREHLHDFGSKTIYGRVANYNADDVVDIISARRATARYLVTRIFRFFVFPLTSSAEDKAIIERFADIYFSSDHSVKTLMREIFISDEFFSNRARNALVKSPTELIVGSFRMLGAKYSPVPTSEHDFDFFLRSRRMGQSLFQPPDVNGWEVGRGWINTTAMIERFNFASHITSSRDEKLGVTNDLLQSYTRPTARETVENFLKALGPLEVGSEMVTKLTSYLESDEQGNKVEFVINDTTIDNRIRGLVHLIMCLQEYHLS